MAISYKSACRCARSNMTAAASYLERAKDEPDKYAHWLEHAYMADKRAREWSALAEKLKPNAITGENV